MEKHASALRDARKCWRCLFGLSPVIQVWHHTSGSTTGSLRATKVPTGHHTTVCRRCRARYRYHCICADVPPWWWRRQRLHLKGDGSWILLSNHARSTASSASPPGPPVQGYFRIPGLALWALLGLAGPLLPLETMKGWKCANI